MLSTIRKDCIHYASLLGDYQSIDCDTLANKYCEAMDAEDDIEQSKYLSALVLRFWYTIDKMYQKCPRTNLDREEFFTWLVEAINYACKYRAWQDKTKHTNAQAAINQCINTIRLQHYYEFNLQKHKANYNSVSLDAPVGSEDALGHEVTIGDTIADDDEERIKSELNTKFLIQSFVNNKKIIDAIIMDTIAFTDVERYTKKVVNTVDDEGNPRKYTQYSSEFWPYKLVQTLGNLPENYMTYFSKKYKVVGAELEASLNAIRGANNQKLYKYLDSCLKSLKHTLKD